MLEALYSALIRTNSYLFDTNRRVINHAEIPVISIGNISTGGSGKTPFTQTIARKLLDIGKRPAIIGRGYKRKSKGEIIVSNGEEIFTDVQSAGDELFLHAITLHAPVIANSNRFQAAETAVKKLHCNVILLDDGFQHRQLHRDLDIVLLDEFTVNQNYLLPKGRLRENFSSLKRADVIGLQEGIDINLIPYSLQSNQFLVTTKTEAGKPYLFNQFTQKNIHSPSSQSVIPGKLIAVSAIAHPDKFEKTLRQSNINAIYHKTFSDHHSYSSKDIIDIVESCNKHSVQAIITTEKDAVKLLSYSSQFERNGIMVYILPITTVITSNEELFDNKITQIINNK